MLRLKLPDASASGTPRGVTVRPRITPHTPRAQQAAPSLPEAALFDLFREAVAVANIGTGRIVAWNRAAELLFGYSAAEAIGTQVELLLPPDVARLHHLRLEHYARSGEVAVLNGRAPLAMPALTRSGDEIQVEMSLAPLEPEAPSENGTRHILLMFRDAIPAQRTHQQALEVARAESARAETEAKLHMSQDLLRDSTRELDTALTRARIAAARLTRQAMQDPTARPQRLALLARVVELRAEEVRRTLQQLTDASAFQSATFRLETERVNLVRVITRVVAAARTRSTAHQIRLAVPQGLTALVDAERIEQVVHDLILQAIRRNPRGCWIDVDLNRQLAGLACIEVRDYGRRLSAKERDRLPEGPSPDRGWFLMQQIVEQHHGRLSIEFPAEGGLRVRLTLPTNRTAGRVK
jgi:PAS domain S-box-containing protein